MGLGAVVNVSDFEPVLWDNGGLDVVMNISDFKPNDIVRITVYDCFSGQAVVRVVEEDRLIADWIYVLPCYECQTCEEKSVEITKKDFEYDIIAELYLLVRKDKE